MSYSTKLFIPKKRGMGSRGWGVGEELKKLRVKARLSST
jgi:hypothetical protein